MYFVYILKSKLNNRYYIGHASNLDVRIERHNKGYVKSTKAYKPWELVYKEGYETKNDAYKREMQIKSYKGGEAFKRLVEN